MAFFLFSSHKSKQELLRRKIEAQGGSPITQVEVPMPDLVQEPITQAPSYPYELPYREEVIRYLNALQEILKQWEETENLDVALRMRQLAEMLSLLEGESNIQDILQGYDYYITQKQNVLQALLALSPPPPCINLHYHYKTAFEESIRAIAGIKDGLIRGDVSYVISMLKYQISAQRHIAQAESEEDSIRRRYGLPPRAFSIIR